MAGLLRSHDIYQHTGYGEGSLMPACLGRCGWTGATCAEPRRRALSNRVKAAVHACGVSTTATECILTHIFAHISQFHMHAVPAPKLTLHQCKSQTLHWLALTQVSPHVVSMWDATTFPKPAIITRAKTTR